MQVSVPQETLASSSSNPLEVAYTTTAAAAPSATTQLPTLPRSSSASLSAASPYSPISDVEAVELDPATLWAALDLPAPESMPSQHTSRRVVLLGRPLSGKRTLCRRLCFAAEVQYAGCDYANDGDGERGGASVDNERQALYNPSSSDDDDAALFPSQHVGGWNMPGAYSRAGAMQQHTTTGPHDHNSPLSHGSGVGFDYVVQRVPMRLARSGAQAPAAGPAGSRSVSASFAAGAAASVNGGGGGPGADVPAQRGSTAGFAASGSLGGTVRRTTEFFCCDNVGALTMALPTLSHVDSALVVMVVDVSDVSTIRQQLDYCYTTLDTYVANVLRAYAPNHDEVRRMQLAASQQDYWFAEEQKLRTTRTALASTFAVAAGSSSASGASSPPRDASGEVHFMDPAANLDKVNGTVFRVPASAGTVCTMHSIIVCTKTDQLDRASRAVGIVDGSPYDNEAVMDRLGIPADMRLSMRRTRLSLLCLTAQLLRQYAMYRRAALASVCQRVSMTTAGASGEYATSGLVHPFFKGLWAYMAYVLYNSKDPNASLPADALRVCGARMNPHALLPCGLDAIGLLNPFVTSSSMQLPEGPSLTSPEEPADSGIRTTAENVITPDGVFALHQRYIEQTQTETPGSPPLWARFEDPAAGADAMVWDSM